MNTELSANFSAPADQALGAGTEAGESTWGAAFDDNRECGDWLAFRTNPWARLEPATHEKPRREPAPSYQWMDDDDWVRRSSAALRKWMDENPF